MGNTVISTEWFIYIWSCIISFLFSLIAHPNQNQDDPNKPKKASSIQYGYLKQLVQECWPEHVRKGLARMK